MVSTINDSILNEFVNATSGNAFELWEILLSKFESQSTANVRQLLTSLLNMKQGNLATGVYVANAEEIASRLTRIVYDNNYNIIAILASYQMINGLDSRFNLFKESMLADDANIMDSKLCGRKILERSERLQLDTKSNLVKSSGTALQVTSRNDLICNYCKKKNHTEDNCFIKFPEKRTVSGVPLPKTVNNKVTTSHNYVLPPTGQPISKKTIKKISQLRSESLANIAECDQRLASALPKTQTNTKKTWFVRSNTAHINHIESGYITFTADSGADVTVKHGNGDGLNDFDPDVSIPLEVADQRKVLTKGKGCITGKIDNIHVAPTFSTSLLSVYQMYSEGKAVLFHPTAGILLADADDMHVSCPNYLSKGFIEGSSFKFKIRTEPNDIIQYNANHINVITTTPTIITNDVEDLTNVTSNSDEQLCILQMQRLGFAAPSRILEANKHSTTNKLHLPKNVNIHMFHKEECDAYHLGKGTAQPHRNYHGAKSTTRIFELLHIDDKIINVPSWGRNILFRIIVDDYSRYKWVLICNRRREAVSQMYSWYRTTVLSNNGKVNRIRMDNAKENISNDFQRFLHRIGARAEYTSPHSSESNGVAERGIRTLMDTMKSLLTGSGLPRAAWGELINTSCFIENRLPTTANHNNVSPYELFHGTSPDLSILRVIGCKCYVHEHRVTRRTLDPNCSVGIMIGYSAVSRRYRILMNRSTGTIRESSHVVFAERIIPSSPEHMIFGDEPDLAYYPSFSPVEGDSTSVTTDDEVEQLANNEVDEVDIDESVISEVDNNNIEEDESRIVVDTNNDNVNEAVEADLRRSNRTIVPINRYVPSINSLKTNSIMTDTMFNELLIDEMVNYINMPKNDTKYPPGNIKFKDAIQDPRLILSMRKELRSLFDIGCIRIVDLPRGRKAIGNVWVHKFKNGPDGEFIRIKSRVCPWGFQQIPDEDYDVDEVSSPTLHMETGMKLLCITVQRNMHSILLDVDGAFQLPVNKQDVYMKFPTGMKQVTGKVLKLDHSMNGTKQSAFNWHELADKLLLDIGFNPTINDSCLSPVKSTSGFLLKNQ